MTHSHIAQAVAAVAARQPHRPATRIREGADWRQQTYAELWSAVRATASALIAVGLQPGDRVAIFANNSPDWTQADLGCLAAGLVPVPIYATSTPDQVAHIVSNAGVRLIFVGGPSEASRVEAAREQVPSLEHVVSFEAAPPATSLADFCATGRGADDPAVTERLAAATGDDLASLIYTSGTTGDPKGVMLRHSALMAQCHALADWFPVTPDDQSLCFLPLSHALERAWTTVVLTNGALNTYVPDAKTVAEMMVLARPTCMVSVPRLFERVYATAHEKAALSASKQRIFDWAIGVGRALQHHYRAGTTPPLALRAQLPVADRLVLRNIRAALGGRKSVLACGGAPLREEIEEFFAACGLTVYQGYGLTEAAPLVTFNSPENFRFGTCGRVMPGGEIRIGADDEVQYRGPNVMAGYWNDKEATEASFDTDDDGGRWLRTGDAGSIDELGFLRITDRIKDIIVTSSGKNISPQPIEGLLLADPLFEYAVLLGDNRPCLTLLVKPSMPHLSDLAGKLGLSATNGTALADHPQVVEALRERVQTLTEKLPHHEQIRDLRVLVEEFTMDNGLLTPTLKVKRRAVERAFKTTIDDMYAKIAELRRRSSSD